MIPTPATPAPTRWNGTIEDLFEFLDGKTVNHRGIRGTLRHRVSRAIYPYPHTEHELTHEPDSVGQRSAAYRATRTQLGDDWITDLTDDFENVIRIASTLGFPF